MTGWRKRQIQNRIDEEHMFKRKFKVICSECSEEHFVEDIKVVNVEENIQGQDVCFFECPITKQITKSLVYGAR